MLGRATEAGTGPGSSRPASAPLSPPLPGRAWESSSYLLPDGAVVPGDMLFVDSVGRPDLEAGPRESAKRAHVSVVRFGA